MTFVIKGKQLLLNNRITHTQLSAIPSKASFDGLDAVGMSFLSAIAFLPFVATIAISSIEVLISILIVLSILISVIINLLIIS